MKKPYLSENSNPAKKTKHLNIMVIIHNIMVKIHNTQDKIIRFLLSNKGKEFTIRAISKKVAIDYKGVHIIVKRLIENNTIKAKKIGQTILCMINSKTFNTDIFKAEFLRKEDILVNKNFRVFYNRIKENIKEPFFILLLFGSYVSGKARRKSDIDIMLITDKKAIIKEINHEISLLPMKIHLIYFDSKEFLSMLKSPDFNVGKEVFNNNIILFGIENYYGLI